jgi:type II secretory pathway component PulK
MRTPVRLSPRRREGSRPAFLLVAVLVCLTLAMALSATSARTLLLERRVLASQQQVLQAEYLAAAGLARAQAQLALDPSFRGETWQLDADQLPGHGPAQVTIRIVDKPDDPAVRQLQAVATLVARGMQVQRTREVQIQAPRSGVEP